MDRDNKMFLNNFQKSRLKDVKRPLHSCLQICNNFYLKKFNNLGNTLVTIINKLIFKIMI